jgi:hypothetical protein
MAKTKNQKVNDRLRPKVTLSKEELIALINFNFEMASHYTRVRSVEQAEHHHKRGKQLVSLRQGWKWRR